MPTAVNYARQYFEYIIEKGKMVNSENGMWWSDHTPPEIQLEIGYAINSQITNLPVNLFIEWFEPKLVEQRWFIEASKHINIPYSTYWQQSQTT